MLNTTAQPQNTTMSNIFNLTSQLMGMTTGATAGGSNLQNNTTSNMNIGGEHFPHFGTIGANQFGEFGVFENNNNNPSQKTIITIIYHYHYHYHYYHQDSEEVLIYHQEEMLGD